MKRNYNAVAFVYIPTMLRGKDFYVEENCDCKPIHGHHDEYDYWVEYDEFGRKILWKDSAGNVTSYSYDDNGEMHVWTNLYIQDMYPNLIV